MSFRFKNCQSIEMNSPPNSVNLIRQIVNYFSGQQPNQSGSHFPVTLVSHNLAIIKDNKKGNSLDTSFFKQMIVQD